MTALSQAGALRHTGRSQAGALRHTNGQERPRTHTDMVRVYMRARCSGDGIYLAGGSPQSGTSRVSPSRNADSCAMAPMAVYRTASHAVIAGRR